MAVVGVVPGWEVASPEPVGLAVTDRAELFGPTDLVAPTVDLVVDCSPVVVAVAGLVGDYGAGIVVTVFSEIALIASCRNRFPDRSAEEVVGQQALAVRAVCT